MEHIIGDKLKLGRKIGSGSFGEIYLATHVDTFEIVTIKIENGKTKHPQLLYEAKLYNILQGGSGIPSIRWSGVDGEDNVLVMDYGFARAQSRGSFCLLWKKVLSENRLDVGGSNDEQDRVCAF